MEAKFLCISYLSIFIFLFKFVLINLTSPKNSLTPNNFNSEIHLIIQGKGVQKLLSDDFKEEPSEVLINGLKGNSCKKSCYLKKDKSNITLLFERQFESLQSMFSNLEAIIEIDLSKFEFSKVKNMEKMFYGLIHLKKINFGNVDTSLVENMNSLFYNCSNLTSIDLAEFNTSKVRTIKNMFYGCSSLKFLNLFNFHINKEVIIDNAFKGIPSDSKYCINDKETKIYLLGNDKSTECPYIIFQQKRKISWNNNEINCLSNQYKYNGGCYSICPHGTYGITNQIQGGKIINECITQIIEGFYVDQNSNTLRKCFRNCISCKGEEMK